MGEFLEVVQTQEAVKGLLNFLKFSEACLCLDKAIYHAK